VKLHRRDNDLAEGRREGAARKGSRRALALERDLKALLAGDLAKLEEAFVAAGAVGGQE
jgi:hypothetical protein